MELYKAIAKTIGSISRCEEDNKIEFLKYHNNKLDSLLEYLPDGKGFVCRCVLDKIKSTSECLVFYSDFQHISEDGSSKEFLEKNKLYVYWHRRPTPGGFWP